MRRVQNPNEDEDEGRYGLSIQTNGESDNDPGSVSTSTSSHPAEPTLKKRSPVDPVFHITQRQTPRVVSDIQPFSNTQTSAFAPPKIFRNSPLETRSAMAYNGGKPYRQTATNPGYMPVQSSAMGSGVNNVSASDSGFGGRIDKSQKYLRSAVLDGVSATFRGFVRSRSAKIAVAVALLLCLVWTFMDLPDNYSRDAATRLKRKEVEVVRSSDSNVPTEHLASPHCSIPHPGKPLLQYALMLDAGSSGSRIHVYRFNYCKASPELEDEIFEHVEPGLSSYVNDPVGAAASLEPLLKVALDNVPTSLHSCTPIAVKATAGLRMLGAQKSEIILDAVRLRLEKHYPFKLIENGVTIMDGRDEGVYAWITVNYLLNNIGGQQRAPTAAIFDLGGGSTQIVFEPAVKEMKPGDHKYVLPFGGIQYHLYQHSYLGYGLNAARQAIKEEFIQKWTNDQRAEPILHPCLPPGHREQFTNASSAQQYILDGSASNGENCAVVVRSLLRKQTECRLDPCSFNGMYQPVLEQTFAENDIYIFSFFYDRTRPMGMSDSFRIKELGYVADRVCAGDHAHFAAIPSSEKEWSKNPDLCLELTFMHVLLKDGYGMGDERIVKVAKKIRGVETGWCLGASIAVLDSEPWCAASAA